MSCWRSLWGGTAVAMERILARVCICKCRCHGGSVYGYNCSSTEFIPKVHCEGTIRICGDAASATVERSIEVLKREFHPGSATEFHERAARPRGSAQALVQCPAAG